MPKSDTHAQNADRPLRIVVENCMFMNGGDAAIQLATRKILDAALPAYELTFCDSGYPAIGKYYPDHDILPLPSFLARRSFAVRAARKILKGRALYRFERSRFLLIARLAQVLNRLGMTLPDGEFRAFEPYLEADLTISAGGTYLVSKYDVVPRLLEFDKDAALKLPTVFFTQSIEEFEPDFRATVLARHFAASPLVLVRHPDSVGHVRDLIGDKGNIVPVADTVFALWEPGPTSVADRRARAGRQGDDRLRIAISVRNMLGFKGRSHEDGVRIYEEAIRSAATTLVRAHGAEVTFLSTCQGIPEYWTDDSAVAEKIAAGLPDDIRAKVTVDRAFHSPYDLIERLKGFDGVIASRLHMSILSICANTPVLPVSYESKFEETFSDLGLRDLVVSASEIDPDTFRSAIDDWLARLDEVNATLAGGAEEMKLSAMSAGRLLSEALKSENFRDEAP